MTIELMDMDVPYYISKDVNDNGIDFIRIHSSVADNEDSDICLEKPDVEELIRVLTFIKDEI